MLSFTSFLTEAKVEKLKHLEHAEDHIVNSGAAGFEHASKTLIGVHNALQGRKSRVKITTKWDGAPSIVFGTHPENGKFFVASKSAFNKNPKINYTDKDIEKNHGHAPGLVEKLKHALAHLPKVTPRGRVFQGDMMYTPGDVSSSSTHYNFKPNTINYSIRKDSEEGKKVGKAKVGVAVHTEYKGRTLDSMKAHFGPNVNSFGKHRDVHVIDTQTGIEDLKDTYKPEHRREFISSMRKAQQLHRGHDYRHLQGHEMHVATYINQNVRSGETASVEGLMRHAAARNAAAGSKLKSAAGKAKVAAKNSADMEHIKKNKAAFQRTFEIHRHLQNAKHALVDALNDSGDYEHSIEGRKTSGEGHVAIINNMPTKLVSRRQGDFAASNLLAGGVKAKMAERK